MDKTVPKIPDDMFFGGTIYRSDYNPVVAVSGSNGSFLFNTLSLGNLNGASFYTSNGSVVASYTVPTQTVQPVAISGSNGSFTFSTLTMGNLNGLSFYTSNNSVVGSYTVPAAQTGLSGIQVSNTTYTSGTVTFQNANGISFGSSGANGISASYTVPAQSVQTIGLYGVGNTTQNSSTTLDARTLSLDGLGGMTVGFSNGSVQISAPSVSTLTGVGGIIISTNGSTISASIAPLSRLIYPYPNLTGIAAPGNATISVQYVPVDWPVTASRVDALLSWSGASSATTNTCAIALSAYAAIYTRNAATLSSLSSGSTQTTYSYASNSAGHTELIGAAIRPMSVPMNVSMTPGEYYVAFNFITATSSIGLSTTNLGQTLSIIGGNQLMTGVPYAEFGNATATSNNLLNGMGLYSAASTGIPASIGIANINATGANLSQANIALVFRNY